MNFKLILFFSVAGFYMNTCAAQTTISGDRSQKSISQRRYGLDPKITLPSRVQRASAETFQKFSDAGMNPKEHMLTAVEKQVVMAAFKALPRLYQAVLKDHLQSISFMDDMPNTALTASLNPEDPFRLYNITFRAAILHEDVSEWLSKKERTCFDGAGSDITISLSAGKLNALVYVLMHEATHVLDGSLGILPTDQAGSKANPAFPGDDFVKGIWASRAQFDPILQDSLLAKNRFKGGGRGTVLPSSQATQMYASLQASPFVSLYSTSSWHEDLAELVTIYHLTQVLKQPFRIVVEQKGKVIFSYEPMRSALVRSRLAMARQFYS
jgi:hypothetical protein